MSEIVLRQAVATDIAHVLRLERCTVDAPHWTERQYAAIVEQDGVANAIQRCFLVAEIEERLAGFAVARVVGQGVEGLAELESIAVDAAFRRLGVGRTLCEAVIAWCRALAILELELEVRSGSEGAIALYLRLNFVTVGRRSGYYRNPQEDALLMQLQL